jgi:tetratricopeptide (TPR) repeat protein
VVDFATDLRRWRNGEPIRARPAGLFERSWLWARRNRMVAALTTCLTVVLMGAFTGLVLLWRIAERGAAVTRVQAFQTNQQRLAAEENLASALSAFDQFSQFVLDEEQLKRPDLVELRRRVAVRWAENYRRLLERQEPDSQLWESLAEGHARIGQTMAMAGSTTESIAAWSQAVQLLQELDRLQPGKRTVLDRLARGQMHLGQLLTGRDDTVAKQTLLQARETAARLLAAEPNESRHRLRWASCQGALSRVATQQGEHQAALELIREARDELFELVRLHPDNVGFLQNLGVAEQNLGLARERAGSGPEQALQDLDRALELRERLVQDGLASSPWDRMNLAKTHGARGEFFKKQGESTRANESFQRAQEIHEAVLDDLPGSVEYRRSFIALLVQRAQFFEELDEREASASFWRRGLDEVLPRLVSNQETEVLPPEAEIPVLPLADFCLREGETNLVTRLASYILERLDRETHTPPARSLGVRLRIAAISRIAMASLLEQRWAEAAADLTKALDAWNLLVDIAPGSADSGLPSIPTIAELQLLLAQALCHLEKTDSADRLLSTAKPFEREPRPAWDSLLSAAWNDELVRKLGSHIPDTNECSKPDN